jgi:cytochrome oxidase Cu insertion factor (SCO1/SenC/PrrC family)
MKKQTTIVLLSFFLAYTGNGQINASLSARILNFKKDTLKLVLQLNPITRLTKTIYVPLVNEKFETQVEISSPAYLYVTDGTNYINGLLEPGDKTNITYDFGDAKNSLKFDGKGSEKFSFLNSFIQFALYKRLQERVALVKGAKYPFDRLFRFIDSATTAFSNQLVSIRSSMSPGSFKLLQADMKANNMLNKYRSVGMVYDERVDEILKKRQSELTPESKKYLTNILKFDHNLFYSSTYVNAVYNILYMHYDALVLANKASEDLLKKYDYLNRVLPANLRAPVLTLFLESDIGKLNQAEDLETVMNKTYGVQKDSILKNYITKRYNDAISFKKGMDAPGFILENERGEKVTLATFKGKVIYMDFWFGACAPCHVLFQRIKPVKEYFSNTKDVVFLCVSIDPKDIWESSLKKYKIEGYHVFTENKERDHPVIKSYKVAEYPTTIIIDRNGKIFMANPSHDPAELQKEIEAASKIDSN